MVSDPAFHDCEGRFDCRCVHAHGLGAAGPDVCLWSRRGRCCCLWQSWRSSRITRTSLGKHSSEWGALVLRPRLLGSKSQDLGTSSLLKNRSPRIVLYDSL